VVRVLRRRRIPLGLISDGPVVGQSAKVKALGAESFFDAIIFTDSWGREYRKPHERAFASMEKRLVGGRPLVYIADNPAKDFIAAKSRGWRTIRMRLEGQLHRDSEPSNDAGAPDFDLSEFSEVTRTLEGMK
jgi:putative hydrolase of the HAD superfamily